MSRISPEEMLAWMNSNLPSFDSRIPDHRKEFRICMFTIASQHVYGNSIEECVSIAMEKTGAIEFKCNDTPITPPMQNPQPRC